MAGQMSWIVNQRGIVLWLLSLAVLYQMAYQVIMWRALREEDNGEQCTSRSLEGGLPQSPRCLEAQLFRAWQQAAPVLQGVATVGGTQSRDRDPVVEDMTTVAPAAPANQTATGRGAAAGALPSDDAVPREDQADLLAADAATRDERMDQIARAIAASLDKSGGASSSWGRRLAELQDDMEAKVNASHAAHAAHDHSRSAGAAATAEERREPREPRAAGHAAAAAASEAKAAYGGQLAALAAEHGAWERSLSAEAQEVHRKLCEDPARRHRPDCEAFLAKLAPAAGLAGEAAYSAKLAAIAANHSIWEHELAADAQEVHRKLCEDPERRHRPDCEAFLAALVPAASGSEADARAGYQSKLVAMATEHASWEHAFEHTAEDLLRELCADPERAGSPPCAGLASGPASSKPHGAALREKIAREAKEWTATLAEGRAKRAVDLKQWEAQLLNTGAQPQVVAAADAAAADGAEAAAVRALRQLHWSEVPAWSTKRQLRGRRGAQDQKSLLIQPEELQASHWAGMIPKVACITAIPAGRASRSQIEDVIREFHRQTYEGPTQLVLVYHFEDSEAAEFVRQLADGFHVKGVAARGPAADFPSATALRFGAWSSDAEVIAHWSFEAQHDPRRLSLQVRALAYTARPACVLRPGTEGAAAAPKAVAAEASLASLVGEAAWMREHWHPRLAEQGAELEAEVRRLAEVAVGPAFALGAPLASRACAGLGGEDGADPAAGLDEPPADLADRLTAALGPEIGDRYRNLAATRRDAGGKLQALCSEARHESDQEKQKALYIGAQRLAAIRADLDAHFARLSALHAASAA